MGEAQSAKQLQFCSWPLASWGIRRGLVRLVERGTL